MSLSTTEVATTTAVQQASLAAAEDDASAPLPHHLEDAPPPQSHQQHQQSREAYGGGHRRVTIGGGMLGNNAVERRLSFGPSLALDSSSTSHNHTNNNSTENLLYGSSRRPSGFGDMDFFGTAGSRRDSLDSTTAVLDAAILDLTRRRLSIAMAPPSGGGAMDSSGASASAGGWGSGSNNNSNSATASSSYSATLAARQQQLQHQQRELEQRQKELELQRQQLIAGMQEHARSANMYAAQQQNMMIPPPHQHQQQQQQQQQWWVCQICSSKAFASQEEAMHHEMTCRGQPMDPRYDHGMAMPIPSDYNLYPSAAAANQGRSYSMGYGGPYDGTLPHTTGHQQQQGNSNILESQTNQTSIASTTMSSGPFAQMKEPIPLAMPSDKEWLTPLHCFVRRHCVEVFTASEGDVSTPSKGKRKPIQVGQVGIRCPHCHLHSSDQDTNESSSSNKQRERGSVYYPTSIASIYNATMNLLQRHLHNCTAVPADIMRRYETLKGDDARSGTSKRYWIESSVSLGLVDTPTGIRFSALIPPPLPTLSRAQQHMTTANSSSSDSPAAGAERRNSNDMFSSNSNAVTADDSANRNRDRGSSDPPPSTPAGEDGGETAAAADSGEAKTTNDTERLVTSEDERHATGFSYQLMSQMQPCVFTEADRLGKRKGLPAGFPGLACRHCFGGYGSGRFFPSSIKTLSDTSKTLNVLHNHMIRCRKCPDEVRENLEKLRVTHDDERSKMRFGSQKAFFAGIWQRLHKNGPPVLHKRKAPSAGPAPGEIASSSSMMMAGMDQQHQHPYHQHHPAAYPPPYPGPPLSYHQMMDQRSAAAHFGPPIAPMMAGVATLSRHSSFSGLDNPGVLEAKRRRYAGEEEASTSQV